MTQRRRFTLLAAAATILASLPLSTVFSHGTWLFDAVVVVGTVSGIALAVRMLRAPSWLPNLAMLVGLVGILTLMFRSGNEVFGVLPTPSTLSHWSALLADAGRDMNALTVPVDDRRGLLFLSAVGAGVVAVLVDLFAVTLRRPALAGLPMLAIYSVPVAVHADSVSWVPFAAGAAGFLWLLASENVDRVRRFGRRFTGDGRDVDRWEPSPLSAAGRRLAVVGVVLAVVLPIGVPGMTAGILDRFGPDGGSGQDGSGNGTSVNLYANLNGQLRSDKTIEMVRVQTNDPAPHYLRFGVADELADGGFRDRGVNGGKSVVSGLPRVDAPSGVKQHPYRATVEILNFDMRLLPVYLTPTGTDGLEGGWQYEPDRALLYSNRLTSSKRTYSFDYVRTEYTPAALRTAGPLADSHPVREQFTKVHAVGVVDELVRELTAGRRTPYDQVKAIYDHFSPANGYRYTLETRPGTGEAQIADFLKSKQGFCEQYSAAMAWLVRAAGIPARVAFGFTRGSARDGDTYTLTNLNLHAWTEVYFDRFGWVPFDPTPASVPGWAPPPIAPDQSSQGPNPLPTRTGDAAPAPASSNSAAAPAATGADGGAGSGADQADGLRLPRWLAWLGLGTISLGTLAAIIAALLLVLGALASPALGRAHRRRQRLATVAESTVMGSRLRAHAVWDELIDTMVDHRLPVNVAASPRAVVQRLVAEAHVPAESAWLLGRAEEQARYARRPAPGDDLPDALAEVRAAISGRAPRGTRLIATVAPPSVLRRWRSALSNAAATVVAEGSRRWNTVARTVSPRRLLARRGAR